MTEKKTPTIVVGVTGCIAAYKACELVRSLMRGGCRVKVVMTENAVRFVGPTTFRALTGEPVSTSLWDTPESTVHHVSLAQEADVFVVAPATANVLAKLAQGRADDLLSTSVLATEAPVIIAPAMNVHMWRADATRDNIATLRSRGATIIEPDSGQLACGDVGEGRLADVGTIAEAVLAEAGRSRDLAGVRVMVTAGPTREPLDPVRFLSNPSSGKSGYAIAEEAARRGADVVLVSGPTTLPDPFGVRTIRVTTAVEMESAVLAEFESAHAVVATAAVSDFRPAGFSASKVKKHDAPLGIELQPNPDILAGLGSRKGGRVLVGYAAETGDPVECARAKLADKNLDMVVANDVADASVGFAGDMNRVWFVSEQSVEELAIASKKTIARILWDRVAPMALAAQATRDEGSAT